MDPKPLLENWTDEFTRYLQIVFTWMIIMNGAEVTE